MTAILPVGLPLRQMSRRLAHGVQQRLLPASQLRRLVIAALRRYQVALVLGRDAGAWDGRLPVYRPLLHQPVEFADAPPSQQLHEIRLGHTALFIQGLQSRDRFIPQLVFVEPGIRDGEKAGADAGLETGRQHQREGGEQGGAVVAAEPLPYLELLRAQQRRGFHGLENVAGGEVGLGGGQLDDDALQRLRTEGHPDQLPKLHGEAGGDAVGEGAGVAHRGVHRHVRVP